MMQEPTIGMIQRTGSSAMDIAYVASGAYDALLMLVAFYSRVVSRFVKYCARSRRCVSDQNGNDLRDIANLREGFSLVVAGTRELHTELLAERVMRRDAAL